MSSPLRNILFYLWGIGIMLTSPSLYASHIIGGSMSYQCLGGQQYELQLTVYIDCYHGGSPFDNPATVGVFNPDDSLINRIYMYTPTIQKLNDQLTDSCITLPPDLCVEVGTYRKTVTFSDTPSNYVLAYQRCCRHSSNKNLLHSDSSGMTAFVRIPDTTTVSCNRGPEFDKLPPIAICNQEEFTFNTAASDSDGDSLVYRLCTPLNGASPSWPKPNKPDPPPYDPIQWASGYSSSQPIQAQPPLSIDPQTGVMTGTPQDSGRFIVGICVNEYRNGTYIGQTRRIVQINVLNCNNTLDARVPQNNIQQCGSKQVSFQNNSIGADDYYWDFGVSSTGQDTSTRFEPTYQYRDTGFYQTRLVAQTDEGCKDTAHIEPDLNPGIKASFSYTTGCKVDSVPFSNQSVADSSTIQVWNWEFGDQTGASVKEPAHYYKTPGQYTVRLMIQDNHQCRDTATNLINYFPEASINYDIDPDIGCTPYHLHLYDSSIATDDYTIDWTFAPSITKEGKRVKYIYQQEGIYTIALSITSPFGCTTTDTFTDAITVRQSPTADFTAQPDTTSLLEPKVQFYDASVSAIRWYWNFDDEDTSHHINPVHRFQSPGTRPIMLVVTHPNNCTDTMIKPVMIEPGYRLHFPNAFSPNGDGRNDRYHPIGFRGGIEEYEIKIWSRWGTLSYSSKEVREGWNGKIQNDGPACPQGVYYYTARLKGVRGNTKEWSGYVTLTR